MLLTRQAVIGLLLLGTLGFPTIANAHEANCPVCKLKVVQDTPQQDNETALRYGRKRIEYRCIYCALLDVNNGAYKDGDLTLLAPSEKKSQPIEILRKEGKWTAPEGTVFVGVKAGHKSCPVTYRAFTSKAAFDAYVARNASFLKDARPLTLDQMIAVAKTP